MFLSYYNDVIVLGVTDRAAQDHVVAAVAENFREAHTHPVQVVFYERENWATRQLKNGATFGTSKGPNKLIRIVNIG